MATAAAAEGGEPPGLGRERRSRFQRSEMTNDTAGGGGREEAGGEPPHRHVLALPAMALPTVISRIEATVPRKARTCLPRSVPSAWWAYKIPDLPPPAAVDPAAEVEVEEARRSSRPKRAPVRVDLPPEPAPAAAAQRPAKKARKRCQHCDAAETKQWRAGPMGRSTLCNACGLRYNTTGTLPEYRPTVSPAAGSQPYHQIWEEPEVPGAIYLVRKSPKQGRPLRTEAPPAQMRGASPMCCLRCGSSRTPRCRDGPMGPNTLCNSCGVQYMKGSLRPEYRAAAGPIVDSPPHSPNWRHKAPAIYLVRKPAKKGKSKKKGQKGKLARQQGATAPRLGLPKNKEKRSCLHCGSSETPQWREGPMGRGTLCNACGVRHKQGRLLPEYRPVASPTFVPSEHANSHRRVLELRRRRQGSAEHPMPQQPVDNAVNLPQNGHQDDARAYAGDHQADARGCGTDLNDAPSPLDSLLLDGPSAPLIVESDDFLIS